MNLLLLFSAAVLALMAAAEPAQTLPKFTARDVYVSCYLLAHDAEVPSAYKGFRAHASTCGLLSLKAITFQEGIRPNSKIPPAFIFCLPKDADIVDNAPRAMAYAFMAFFDSESERISSLDGEAAFYFALGKKWPCQ